uniref:Uncharacterized protein n=1 Tax=Anguilla anguilla TaxID=7936 RepID=A0A0E9PF31_ANGAN
MLLMTAMCVSFLCMGFSAFHNAVELISKASLIKASLIVFPHALGLLCSMQYGSDIQV